MKLSEIYAGTLDVLENQPWVQHGGYNTVGRSIMVPGPRGWEVMRVDVGARCLEGALQQAMGHLHRDHLSAEYNAFQATEAYTFLHGIAVAHFDLDSRQRLYHFNDAYGRTLSSIIQLVETGLQYALLCEELGVEMGNIGEEPQKEVEVEPMPETAPVRERPATPAPAAPVPEPAKQPSTPEKVPV
jgi:hypothetical protein